MLSSIEPLAAVGVTAIADSSASADDLYVHVRAVLNRSAEQAGAAWAPTCATGIVAI
jgi:hypothetical protein